MVYYVEEDKMNTPIQITVGIPVYNVEKYIEKSLRSVLDQTFNLPYEIIVVDDRGNDRSMEIVKRVISSHQRGHVARIIQHEENKGLGEARNTIIRNAQGKYLFYLDSDDWITADCLEKLYASAEREQAEIVCGSAMQEVEATKKQSVYFQYADGVYEHEAVGAWLLSKNIQVATTAWNKLYRMDFIRKYDIRTIHRVFEDQWFSYTSWLYAHKIVLLSDLTLFYNIRMSSIMTSGYGKKGNGEAVSCCCEIVNKLCSLIDSQFRNTIGAYDLYYRAIKSNLDILSSSVYSDVQLAYIRKELGRAATRVPSIKSLYTARHRFVYFCSRIYETAFSFYHYDNAYTKLFGKNEELIRKLPYTMKKVLFISHEGSRTGAPLVLLSLVKAASALSTPPIGLV